MNTQTKKVVLVVDDTPENIMVLHGILGDLFTVKAALSGEKAIAIAKETPSPDLILLDIMMPSMDGYEVCRILKADPSTSKIPIIFVTAMTEVEDEAKGFDVGGVDYITKPVSPSIVLARVNTHIELADQQFACEKTVEQQVALISKGQKDAIYMLGHAGHYNDDDTGVHIWRMASYAKALAAERHWTVEMQNDLLLAAPMHDTGKIGIPDSILKKPGKLTDEEWVTMRKHTTIGHKILSLSDAPVFKMAADIALSHHERWDGSGYPKGLEGDEIPTSARIVAIADVFDALTMARPYKNAWESDRAFEYIGDSKGHFDPHLIDSFLSIKDTILTIKKHWKKKEKRD
ncbi:HD domain-containing phosphohydrolase [uncultured Pseudodesulfovibrio sp.]|uniref:response regulator n=1 Tax=uncultured Pseudodesulfovibrio sp. TaxID=2035858 RepID=UPI0029C80031|nr:HD domain-containing phosphohydrolase [uncultured Pseudodesulfovibrio sp.]